MEEDLINPISTDQKMNLKDLSLDKEKSGETRKKEDLVKNKRTYYLGLAFLMIVLVFLGIFFGFYLKSRQAKPEPVLLEPTPTLIQNAPEATPATTIEVIKNKMDVLDKKLKEVNLEQKELYPPQIDYSLSDLLKKSEE